MTNGTDRALPPESPAFGKQQVIAGIITLVILVLVFGVVLPQFGDYDAAWEAIADMDAWQLGMIALATVVMIAIYVLPYPAALPMISYWQAFKVRQTSFMISNVVPAGGAFGLAVQFGMLQSYGIAAAPSTAAIGITGAWNSFVTLSLPVTALIGLAISGQASVEAGAITVVATLAVVVAVVLFALVLRNEETARRIGGWADSFIGRIGRVVKREITVDATGAIVSFRSSIVDVVVDRWLLITLANVGQQLAQFSILYLAIVALQGGWSGPITFFEALAAFAFGRLATFIPVPPGGLGTTDAIITSILVTFGLDNNSALASTMIWRAATYFPQVLIGAGTLLVWRRDQRRSGARVSAA
jgi:uncharacterized protein (TIRG00374 family)